MAARGRLQSERKALRQDRGWIRNPQNPRGFEAKPSLNADGTQNLMVWDCAIPGKDGTPWEGGLVPLVLRFTDDYATAPPTAAFKLLPGTNKPLFHPNVYPDGRICLNVLKPASQGGVWTPAHTIKTVLIAIQRLLETPNNDDAAQAEARSVYGRDRAEYERRVRAQMAILKDNGYTTVD